MTKILVLDNYDSFTYNLVHLFKENGCNNIVVKRNDEISVKEAEVFDKIVLSPGPGIPQQAGIMLDLIAEYYKTKSILGVCLGHQAIACALGGKLQQMERVVHGQQTAINIVQLSHIFGGLPQRIDAGRYHSWIVKRQSLPHCLHITAEDDDENIMAFSHKDYDVHGLQFHPESIMTSTGKQIIGNWILTKEESQ
ncbi:aminodeoxychorismate/anthranilate synthase component II [Candidatus Uabimicrobium sp. HlEnr_7]|uniref:anthranilate synthase component II n=1 Tax=Candidatus Uabimicrobium helgolandensis TaxID=3095367 RepID=UPI0035583097